MRHAIQILRDIAEERSLLAHEANDRDSSEAWENIGIKLNEIDKEIAHDWRIIQQRQLRDAPDVLAHIAGHMHAAVCNESRQRQSAR